MVSALNRREFIAGTLAVATSSVPEMAGGQGPVIRKSPDQPVRDGRSKVPVIDVTDLYHPFEDPGDNFDLVHGYALSEVDLRGVVLDTTAAFRLPVANHPTLWHDPNGPREPGIIPMMQLNSIFDRPVPFAVGPYTPMGSLTDEMRSVPAIQQAGVDLILEVLRKSEGSVDILSFGSCRSIAVAYNREPRLVKEKARCIHISAGTASRHFEFGSSPEHNNIPGGEWNVALDPFAFRRLLTSDLRIALYPCAGVDGAFSYDAHNTYWRLPDRHFIRNLDPRIRSYLTFALGREIRADFLRALDGPLDEGLAQDRINSVHHVWETAVWLNVTSRKVVERDGKWQIVSVDQIQPGDRVLRSDMLPCALKVREDARIAFEITEKSNISIFNREDPKEYETAMQQAWPALWSTFSSSADA